MKNIKEVSISSESLNHLRTVRLDPNIKKFIQLTNDQKAAYQTLHKQLEELGTLVKASLSDPDMYEIRLTSGFNSSSGIRGYIPKDLWVSVSPKANTKTLAGNPQLYVIISERGIEYGYGASVHPSQFSDQKLKKHVRSTAPKVFKTLPSQDSIETTKLAKNIQNSGRWNFLKKQREAQGHSDFNSLQEWLAFLQSEQGLKEAGGAISRYIEIDNSDHSSLSTELPKVAKLFEPLMDRDWNKKVMSTNEYQTTFANRFFKFYQTSY